MKRRTLLRRVGATSIAAAAAGTAAGRTSPRFGVGRRLDVSDVEGRTTLAELLGPGDRRRLRADVDPRQVEVAVAADADVITLDDCCVYCCSGQDLVCEDKCDCCTCDFDC